MIAAFVKNVGGNVGLGKGEITEWEKLFVRLENRNSAAHPVAKREMSPIGTMPGTRLPLRYKLNRTSPGAFRRLEPSNCDLRDDNHHITISMRELAG